MRRDEHSVSENIQQGEPPTRSYGTRGGGAHVAKATAAESMLLHPQSAATDGGEEAAGNWGV